MTGCKPKDCLKQRFSSVVGVSGEMSLEVLNHPGHLVVEGVEFGQFTDDLPPTQKASLEQVQ